MCFVPSVGIFRQLTGRLLWITGRVLWNNLALFGNNLPLLENTFSKVRNIKEVLTPNLIALIPFVYRGSKRLGVKNTPNPSEILSLKAFHSIWLGVAFFFAKPNKIC